MGAPIIGLFNGQAADTISMCDRAVQYGDGLFETIAISAGKLLAWQAHMARLKQGCEHLRIIFNEYASLLEESERLARGQDKAILKIILSRGEAGRGYQIKRQGTPNRILLLFPWLAYPLDYRKLGVRVQLCRFRYGHHPGLAGIKHLNRLEQVLARAEITDKAVQEGIVLDQAGLPIEGTMSNLFLRHADVIYTPDLSHCGVAGVIRQCILDNQHKLGLNICVSRLTRAQLLNADELFLSNSIIGIWPVKQLELQYYSDFSSAHRVANFLRQEEMIVA